MPPPPAAEVLTAETQQDPEQVLRFLSWLVITFSVAQLLVFSFGRDQATYGLIAEGILRGEVPYLDRWDFKPPGIYFIYAASYGVFGKSMMAPRLVEALMVIGAVLGLRRLGGVFFGGRTAGLMAGAVYALVHAQFDFWHTGQPESFAGPLTVYALVLSTHGWSRHRERYAWMGVGLLFGLAFLLKPLLGAGVIACGYFVAATRRAHGRGWWPTLSPLGWMGLSSLLPVLACVAWFVTRGGWTALTSALFEFAPAYAALGFEQSDASSMFYESMTQGFFGLSSLLAMGTIAAASIHPRAEREREGLMLLLGVLAFHFVGITIAGRFFQHQFGASVPLIALIAGTGYYKLWKRLGPGPLSHTAVLGVFLLVAALMRVPVDDAPHDFGTRSTLRMRYLLSAGRSLSREELDERLHYVAGYNLQVARQAAYEVKRHLPPGGSLYIWGFEPVIYSLSEAALASRYIYNVAQRSPRQSHRARQMLYQELTEHPPSVVLTQKLDVMPSSTGSTLDSTDSLPQFPRMERWLHKNYQAAQTIEHFTLWLPRRALGR